MGPNFILLLSIYVLYSNVSYIYPVSCLVEIKLFQYNIRSVCSPNFLWEWTPTVFCGDNRKSWCRANLEIRSTEVCSNCSAVGRYDPEKRSKFQGHPHSLYRGSNASGRSLVTSLHFFQRVNFYLYLMKFWKHIGSWKLIRHPSFVPVNSSGLGVSPLTPPRPPVAYNC